MAIYHNNADICSGKKGGSAVASAAYQAGEKLLCEVEKDYKDYTHKENVLDNGIVKPDNAPDWCLDRERLWNEVEKKEGLEGQYARKHNLALPKELSFEEQKQLVLSYCRALAKQGMVCDWAMHNNKDGTNPHCHIMTTMRAFNEKGEWMAKEKNVTIRDSEGKAICIGRDKKGRKRYKHTTIKTTNWDETATLIKWRNDWEVLTNQALEKAGSDARVSAKSFRKQGRADLPTQHLGYQANYLEKKGVKTDRGEWNRQAKEFNDELNQLLAETEKLSKVVQKAEVIYYEQARAQLKPNVRQTFDKSRRRQGGRLFTFSNSRGLHLPDLQELHVGMGQTFADQEQKLYDSVDLYGNGGNHAQDRTEGNQGISRTGTTRKSDGSKRLFPVSAHKQRGLKGAKLGAVTILSVDDLNSNERRAVARKVMPFLKDVFKNEPDFYKQACDNLNKTVFAKSKNGNIFLLDIKKDDAIKNGFLTEKGKPKKMPAKSITKGVKACGGELFRAGKDSAKKLLSAMQDKTRKEHHKQAKEHIKDAVFRTPMKAIGEIFSNPITGILKLPARALEMIGSAVSAGIELMGAAGKKENEKTPSGLKNAEKPLVRSAGEDKKSNTSNLI